MKIAHVIATFPPHIGGMGTVAYNEARLLSELGHSITVFTLRYPNARYHDEKYPFRVIRLKPLLKFGDAGFVPQLTTCLKGFDIIHVHYPFYGGIKAVLAAVFLYKKKLIATYHMDAEPIGLIKKAIQYFDDALFSRLAMKRANHIIAVDERYFNQVRFNRLIERERLTILPNGVDSRVFFPAHPDLHRLNLEHWGNKKIILFVGNPLPVKRLDLLILALEKISDPNVVLLVVGGGYEIKRYRELVMKLGLAKRVHFMGSVINTDRLADLYRVASCLAVPSDTESFSLVVAEAFASGCPVVATDIPGIHDRIDNGINGILVKPDSAGDLARGIERCLNLLPVARESLIRLARKKALTVWNWSKHVDTLEKIYKKVMEY